MNTMLREYALGVWVAVIMLAAVGLASMPMLVIGVVAGTYYLWEVSNGNHKVHQSRSRG